MAERDPSGVGGLLGQTSASGGPASVFRGKGEVGVDYKDVIGLRKEVENLSASFKALKTNIEALDTPKVKKALDSLQKIGVGTGGGGTSTTQGSTASNGGDSSFGGTAAAGGGGGGEGGGEGAAAAGGAAAPQQRENGGKTGFGGLSRTQAIIGGFGMAAMGIAQMYGRRADDDLASDVVSMRYALAAPASQFSGRRGGLSEANRYVRDELGAVSMQRSDMIEAAATLQGRYGTMGSQTEQLAMQGTRAITMGVPGMPVNVGAEMYNRLQAPQVINRMRNFAGTSSSFQLDPAEAARKAVELTYQTDFANITSGNLNHFRPGMPLYDTMQTLTGGDEALSGMLRDLAEMQVKWRETGQRGEFDPDRLARDRGLQKELFGDERPLYLSKMELEAGKVVSQEKMLELSRSGLVTTNEWLGRIHELLRGTGQDLNKHLGPLGNLLGGLAGPLDRMIQLLSVLVVANAAGKPGAFLPGLGGKAGTAGKLLRGAGALGAGMIAADVIDGVIPTPGDSSQFDAGNVLGWGARGAGVGAAIGSVVPGAGTLVGAKVGGAVGLVGGVGKELWGMIGDPTEDGPAGGPAQTAGGFLPVSHADAVLKSRNDASDAAVTNMAPDFKQKLAAMFQANPKLRITSGWRDSAQQARLYDRWVRRVPGQAPAAKPGSSNHEFGLAVDINPRSEYGWLQANAGRFGLVRPMDYEPWHFEPPNARARRGAAGAALPVGPGFSADFMSSTGAGSTLIGASATVPSGSPSEILLSGPPTLTGRAITPSGGTGYDLGAVGAAEWSGGAGALSINQTAALARAAGLTGDSLVKAVAIAMGESSLNPGAEGDQHLANSKWGNSVGLWQIRSLRAQMGTGQSRDASRLKDPSFNAQAMMEISSGGSNWRPWTVYTSGSYQQYMGAVQQALTSGIGDPVEQLSPAPAPSVSVNGGGVTIHAPLSVTVASASQAEAVRFAQQVIEELERKMADSDVRSGH